MRAVLQRVARASVTVEGEVLGKIGKGFMILLGVEDADTEEITDKMADKICKLRIFEDENGKTNLSLADVGGRITGDQPVYPLCRLQKRQPSKLRKSRCAGYGRTFIRTFYGPVQKLCGCSGKRAVWRRYEGGAVK